MLHEENENGSTKGRRKVLTTLRTTQRITRKGEMSILLHREDQNLNCQGKGSLEEGEKKIENDILI